MRKKEIKIGGLILGIVLVIYFVGAIIFSIRSYPNTSLNGLNKGFKPIDSLFYLDSKKDRVLSIKGRNNVELDFKADDISFKSTVEGKPVHRQNPWMWPIEIFKKFDYSVNVIVNYDEQKLDDIINKSKFITSAKDPKDAQIVFDKDKIKIEDEVEGSRLDVKLLKNNIITSLKNELSELKLDSEYLKPKLRADSTELKERFKKLEKISMSSYIFDFDDRKYELKGEKLISMYDLIDGKYVPNSEKLSDYIAEIAKETDTYATKRKFKATDLGEINVEPGIYGWQMNVRKTRDNLLKMIEENKSGKVEINYNLEGLSRKKDDIGKTYIEIDLSRQKMWFYKDGELVLSTPVVSGNGNYRNAATPIGVNKVWSKEENVELKGNNAISGARYTYPVKYWMPVGWTGSGIHDSFHRDVYGGDEYLSSGGSSCVNTPEDKMKVIFDNVPLNTPVVIYESSTDNSPTEFEKQDMMKKEGSFN